MAPHHRLVTPRSPSPAVYRLDALAAGRVGLSDALAQHLAQRSSPPPPRAEGGRTFDLERTPAPTVDDVTYPIAQAAERSGLSVDTLRYYERIGLIDPPLRDAGGRRSYSDDDLAWLDFLTKLRTTGMPIRMMREYATLRRRGLATTTRRKQILLEQRADVRARIAELTACLEVLDSKITNYEQCERDLAQELGARQEVSA